MSAKYTIRHDYHAVHHSGHRAFSAVKFIVLHDMEGGTGTGAAESTGRWFEMGASGGSTQYGIDNDSIQQYLSDDIVCWGAPYMNTSGLHIEQYGFARWNAAEWHHTAAATLDRCAWLIARKATAFKVPIRKVSDGQLRNGVRGITTHAQCTRVFGGTHTDPGPGYPFDFVLANARHYQKEN